MTIPTLKRVKVSSVQELEAWLKRASPAPQSVMLTTLANADSPKHISPAQIDEAVTSHGWKSGRRYTLNAGLIGHVITIPQPR